MSCTITDKALDNSGTPAPQVNSQVRLIPATQPVFVKIGGVFREVLVPTRPITIGGDGTWTTIGPWPSECDPSTALWDLLMPDGTRWRGAFPEGLSGPFTVNQLKTTYGWILQSTATNPVLPPVGGSGGTLALDYANSTSAADSTMLLTSTGGGVRIWDNTVPLTVPIFDVASSSGALAYFDIKSTQITLGNGTTPLAVRVPIADSNGPYTHALTLGNVADQTWLKITAGDPARYADFYGCYASFPGAGGYRDDVFAIGHNIAPGGGAVIAGRAALSDAWESYFIAGHPQQERHIRWLSPTGVETRLLSAEGHDDDNTTALYLYATNVFLGSGLGPGGNQQILLAPTVTNVSSPTGLRTISLNDTATTLVVQNGVVGDTNRSSVVCYADGSVYINSRSTGGATGIGRINSSSGVAYAWDHTASYMYSPDNNCFFQSHNTGLYLCVGTSGGTVMMRASNSGGLGFYGHSPTTQAAHPVTLADVITALTNLGLTA